MLCLIGSFIGSMCDGQNIHGFPEYVVCRYSLSGHIPPRGQPEIHPGTLRTLAVVNGIPYVKSVVGIYCRCVKICPQRFWAGFGRGASSTHITVLK